MNTSDSSRLKVWIGLLSVRTEENNPILDNCKKAYVNGLAMAKSRLDYVSKVKQELLNMNLELIDSQDIEPLDKRLKQYQVDSKILDLANKLLDGGEKVVFSTFHTYD